MTNAWKASRVDAWLQSTKCLNCHRPNSTVHFWIESPLFLGFFKFKFLLFSFLEKDGLMLSLFLNFYSCAFYFWKRMKCTSCEQGFNLCFVFFYLKFIIQCKINFYFKILFIFGMFIVGCWKTLGLKNLRDILCYLFFILFNICYMKIFWILILFFI